MIRYPLLISAMGRRVSRGKGKPTAEQSCGLLSALRAEADSGMSVKEDAISLLEGEKELNVLPRSCHYCMRGVPEDRSGGRDVGER